MMLIKLCLIVGWFSICGAIFGEFAFGHMFDKALFLAVTACLFLIILVSVFVLIATAKLLIEFDDWMEDRK